MADLIQVTAQGLFCPAGNFFVDPWAPVERAVLTHGHSDHAYSGCRSYLSAAPGEHVLRARLGDAAPLHFLPYGEMVDHQGVKITLFPAGHVLGSAQVRLEYRGEVWVISGDYKLAEDPTCTRFEPVRCHVFWTESTFGLPIYRWAPTRQVVNEIRSWWKSNQERGKASVLFGYALGKAQRILALLEDPLGPIFCHGAVERMNRAYRDSGVRLPSTVPVSQASPDTDWSQALILAPPSAAGNPWLRRFDSHASGFLSGWMRIRGARRRRAMDRGFVLSDHADWPGLNEAIRASGAEKIFVTHGQVAPMVRWLREQGFDAIPAPTHYEGEFEDPPEAGETA